MPQNDRVLLDAVLLDFKDNAPSHLDDADLFELFAATQSLKEFQLSDEELLAGLMGGGDEGGVDGLFVFQDDRLIGDDSDRIPARRGVELTLHVIQAKRSPGFAETGPTEDLRHAR